MSFLARIVGIYLICIIIGGCKKKFKSSEYEKTNIHTLVSGESYKIDYQNFQKTNSGFEGELEFATTVNLNEEIILPVKVEVTSKGNGIMTVANLKNLHIYDTHDDGMTYENGLLDTEFKDINGDNIKDLIISGIVKYWAESGCSKLIASDNVIFIYTYDNNSEKFVLTFKKSTFDLEIK